MTSMLDVTKALTVVVDGLVLDRKCAADGKALENDEGRVRDRRAAQVTGSSP